MISSRALKRWPGTRAAQLSPRQVGAALFGLLAFGEVTVLAVFSPPLGLLLLTSTGGLVFVANRREREIVARAEQRAQAETHAAAEGMLLDAETALPNRQHLIDQLSREMARTQRYAPELTLVTVEVSRFEDVKASWGGGTAKNAIRHVAETLRRVTRASDFLARLDEARFVVVLANCTAEQAVAFGERVALAVSNRPLRSANSVRVPLYVSVDVSALQYDPDKFRGPLDFLSAAGGDRVASRAGAPTAPPARRAASDPRALRRQLIRDYYPAGEMQDFADAYRAERRRAV